MTDIILHHYDASPFTQKALRMLGLKKLEWRSVETPMLLPKPDLVCLTGGYRGTPVMQIGADIYIDSQRIARELERRYPEPTLFPAGDAGLGYALVKWSDDFFRRDSRWRWHCSVPTGMRDSGQTGRHFSRILISTIWIKTRGTPWRNCKRMPGS